MKIKTGTYTLKSHGAGALYEAWVKVGKVNFRIGMGAYGNIARNKGGNFSYTPYITHYRGVAVHLHWFNLCFSIIYVLL